VSIRSGRAASARPVAALAAFPFAFLSPHGAAAAAAVVALAAAVVAASLLFRELRRRRGAERLAAELGRQLRAVSGGIRESVVAYAPDLRVALVNPAFEALTGYTPAELRAQEFLEYIHPDDRTAVLAELESVRGGNTLLGQEYRVITRDGRIRWVSGTWAPLRDERGRPDGVLSTEADITERRRAEDELRHEAELFRLIIEVQRGAAQSALDPEAVLRLLVERSQVLTRAGGATIELIQGDGLAPRAQLGMALPRVDPKTSLGWLTARTGHMHRCDDATLDLRVDRAAFLAAGVRSLLSVPLNWTNQPVGALTIVSAEPQAFGERDARAVELLAGMAGAALSQATAVGARQARLEERTRALQDSEMRFKQLVDAAQEGIWVLDDRGVTTYVNTRLTELLGHEPGDMLGRPLSDFTDSQSRAEALRRLARDRATRPGMGDLRFSRKDGSELWAIVATSPIVGRDGAHVGTVVMLTDITERRRAEDRLRRSADRLKLLHEIDQAVLAARSLPELGRAALGRLRRLAPCRRCTAVLYDFERGEARLLAGYDGVSELSAAPMSLSDFSTTDQLRLGAVRYVDDLARLEPRPPLLQRLLDEGLHSILSVPLMVDGEVIGELNLAATSTGAFEPEHRDVAQEVALPLAIAVQQTRLRDALRRDTAELQRQLARRTAELQETSGELDAITGAIAHELRAPLRQIHSFSQLLLDEGRLEQTAHHHAHRVHDGARTLGALMDGVLQVARVSRQALLRRPTPLAALVDDARRELEPLVDGREIRWQIGDLPTVDGDPTLLGLAVRHLLDNALKFTAPHPRATIRIACAQTDGQLGLSVADDGVGFDGAHATRLFQPFQRLHRGDEFPGLGLGLAVVRRVAVRHGGRAWAESEPGAGTTIYFTVGATSDTR
jgi:PAS domain S-box-containing protein